MGKQEAETAVAFGEPSASDSFCTKTTCKWVVPVILGIYVLAFALWSIRFRGSSDNDSQPASQSHWPHVEASFRLQRSVSEINESLPQLELDLQNEIGIPDTQINIVSIVPLSSKNRTEVRFTVSPYRSDGLIPPAEMSLLKETFVELFMRRSANLSLTSTVFGKASHFEVLYFPGGITVVPLQSGFPLSKVLVLFNFTLHDSLSHVHRNFAKFRDQLKNGITLNPDESLFVQLTNLDGSTINSPLVVQTSILPVVGVMLPSPRLKQLAREIVASRRNLGLNHTLFGRVKEIELSSYLEYSLNSAQPPSPSPSPVPSMSPNSPTGVSDRPRHGGYRRHWRYSPSTAPADSPYYHSGRSTSRGITPAPYSEGALAPSYAPSHSSRQFLPSPSPSPLSKLPPGYKLPSEPSSPSSPAIVPSGPRKSQPVDSPPPVHVLPVMAPLQAPSSFNAPLEAPPGFTPSFAPSPLQLHKRIASVPVASPYSTSSGD
eukprot:c15604_g1_i1 orf=836-2299(+)